MPYSLLASLVLAAHVAFVLFAALGGLLVRRWRLAPWFHLPALTWGVFIEVTGGLCPLTPLENALRLAAGEAGYQGGFLDHYLVALLYPDALPRATQFVLAGVLVLLNVAIYAVAWRPSTRRRAARPRPGAHS